jgi:hypothetical protein
MNCIQVANGDFDKTLKTMFRRRGETDRIVRSAELGEPIYKSLKLDKEFRSAIGALMYCVKIRNQYSHSVWWDDYSGHLAFANIENIALLDDVQIDLLHLPTDHICLHILQWQESYFSYVDKLLSWINFEGRYKAGKLSSRIYPKPPQMKRPPLRLPREGCSSQTTCLGLKPILELRNLEKRDVGPATQTPPHAGQP